MDISCATIQYNMDKGRKLSYNYCLILNDIDTSDSTAFFIIRQCFEIWSRVTRYQVSRISSGDFFFYGYFRRIRRGESLCDISAYFVFKGATPGYNRGSWSCRQRRRRYSSVRVRESSLQTSPCGLCERCLCLRTRRKRGTRAKLLNSVATRYFYDILSLDKIRMINASRFI